MKILALFLFVTAFPLFVYSQSDNTERLVFYNVENLFDIENDSLTKDDEFTPLGERRWTYFRYQKKLHHTAKALLCAGEWKSSAIIGLAEIENKSVLEDLVRTPELKKLNYKIIHYPSRDRRGIDVAMLYRENSFIPIYSKGIKVVFREDPSYRTRDMLYCKGILLADTIHWFMCHWPSRYGGQKISEPKRIAAAVTLRSFIDSILASAPHSNIIVGGDFNDEWDSESLLQHFGACSHIDEKCSLVNLMAKANPHMGSHKYKGSWSYLDQIIVSKGLLNKSGNLTLNMEKSYVANTDVLLEKDLKYPGYKPYRTFIGYRYNGGFSDHLPIYIDITQSTP